jgi:two-component system NarL family sensor kinase
MHRPRLLTGLLLLTLTAGCLSLKAEPVRDFQYALQIDSLAEISFAEGDMRGCISLWLEAAEIADRYAATEQDSLTYSGFLQSLGVCYRRISMMDSTLYYYNRAWDIIQDKTSPAAVSEKTRLLTSMAILLTFMGRDEESMQYADRAMEMAEHDSDMEMVMYAATNAGGIYARNRQFDKGTEALRTAMAKAGESGLPDKQLSALTMIVTLHKLSGQRDSVDYYMARAEKFAEQLPPESVAVLGFRETQAQILRDMGRYAESNAIFRKLLSAAGENSSVREDTGWLNIARNYADMGQWSNAADSYEKAYFAVDSFYNADITAQVSEWSAKYGAAEKELEISRLEQESLRNRAALQLWIIIAVVLIAVLAGVVLTVVFRRRHQKKVEELRLAQKYIDGLEKERARVARDLHDGVCNDLLGIGMQLSTMGPDSPEREEVLSMLEGLRSEVRTISHDMMPPQFNLSDIEEVMEMYTERFRSQTSAGIEFNASLEGSRTWQQVPERIAYEVYRIFQEQMGNIIRHSGATRIEAALKLSDTVLSLTISNDGRAFDPTPSREGIGLTVMSERAKAIGAVISGSASGEMQVFRLDVPLPSSGQ